MDIYQRSHLAAPNHGNGVTVRPLPIYPDNYIPPGSKRDTRFTYTSQGYTGGQSRTHVLHRSFQGISPHDQPILRHTSHNHGTSSFSFHNLWNSGQHAANFGPVPPVGDERPQGTPNRPIIDFPDNHNEPHRRSVEGDEFIEPVNFIDNGSITSATNEEDLHPDGCQEMNEQTEEDNSLQLETQAPRIPNDDYVSLETIRKVKAQARQQSIRMRESRRREKVEMIDLSGGPTHDRPRRSFRREQFTPDRNGSSASYYRDYVHNPTATVTASAARSRQGPSLRPGDLGRMWNPGHRSSIPDGIIAGSDTNVYPQRLVPIPDSTYSATIYASTERSRSDNNDVTDITTESSRGRSSRQETTRTNRPPGRVLPDNHRRQLRGGEDYARRTRHTSSDHGVVLVPSNKSNSIDARKCKQLVVVFVIFVLVLVLVVLIGLIATFLFSPAFQGCRGNEECTRKAIVITGVVIGGGVLLCLCGACCMWCMYVSHSHILSRRRAYPIHHHPSNGMGMG